MLKWRAEAIAARKQFQEGSVPEKESFCGERIDLLLQRCILLAESIDGGTRVEGTDQAACKRRNEDQCNGGGGDDCEAIAKSPRRVERANLHGTSLPAR